MVVSLRRSAPHRVRLDDIGGNNRRVSAREAMTELRAKGLDSVCSADLEVYELVMLPAEFKRLCARLDKAVADFLDNQRRNTWSTPGLPFGEDLQDASDRERRRRWGDRPNGEPLPCNWERHVEWLIPGRLKLVVGREFTAVGVRGRLRFRHTITTATGDCWVEAIDRDGRYRSLAPERVRTVHRKTRMGTSVSIKPRTRR